MNPFRVYITPDYSGKLHIVIMQQSGRETYAARRAELVFEKVPEGSFFREPTFEISSYHAKDFLAALKEALDQEKLPEGRLEGELRATKYHLEDMRQLVLDLHGNKNA